MMQTLEPNKIENVAKSIALILTTLILSFFMLVLFSELHEETVSSYSKFCLFFIFVVNAGILLLIYASIRDYMKTYF
jgi:uncharacterized membrane protein